MDVPIYTVSIQIILNHNITIWKRSNEEDVATLLRNIYQFGLTTRSRNLVSYVTRSGQAASGPSLCISL